jgi:4-diphosphocytidyl-2-C-methyl-D-erythritol kinase
VKTIELIAPAKVNLFLGIGERRADGYHDATTVMHALSMRDSLRMTRLGAGEHAVLVEPCDEAQPLREFEIDVKPGSGLQVTANVIWHEGIPAIDIPHEENLACRAVHALARALDRHEDEYIRMTIDKHIPHQTGLGGGSADAAAALVGAADLWDVAPDDPRLEETAQALGADVRFFLHGGSALLDGRGDHLVHRLPVRRDALVIVRPEGGVSTGSAYAAFDEAPAYPSDETLAAVAAAPEAASVPLWNNLQAPAEQLVPELAEVRAFLEGFDGVRAVLLCGSGSGTFAVCDTAATAQGVATEAKKRGLWARTTSFSPIRAAKLPDKD